MNVKKNNKIRKKKQEKKQNLLVKVKQINKLRKNKEKKLKNKNFLKKTGLGKLNKKMTILVILILIKVILRIPK
jgi:hypothetical protein